MWNGTPMPIVSLVNTKLDLAQLSMNSKSEAHYSEELPGYLSTLFPMFGTTALGKSTNNNLYLPQATTAYLLRLKKE